MTKSVIWSMLVVALLTSACSKNEATSDGSNGTDTSASATTTPEKEAAPVENASSDGYKRYGIESGIVEYNISGMQTGTETLYFDHWGMREAKYTNAAISFGGVSKKIHTLTLTRNDSVYSIDLDSKTGTAMQNPMMNTMMKNAKGKDLMEMGMEMMKNMGGEKIGTEEILGKTCDVWEIKKMGSKASVWNAIPMKTEASMMGMTQSIVATKIDEDASIPEEKMRIPSDVKMTQGGDLQNMMKTMPNMKGMKGAGGMQDLQKLMK